MRQRYAGLPENEIHFQLQKHLDQVTETAWVELIERDKPHNISHVLIGNHPAMIP